MSYLARLKTELPEKLPHDPLTKPTKAPSVSSVSTPSWYIREKTYTPTQENGHETITETPQQCRGNEKARCCFLDSNREVSDPLQREALAMLRNNPCHRYGITVDTDRQADTVIMALAIRDVAVVNLLIPRNLYDPGRILEELDRQRRRLMDDHSPSMATDDTDTIGPRDAARQHQIVRGQYYVRLDLHHGDKQY